MEYYDWFPVMGEYPICARPINKIALNEPEAEAVRIADEFNQKECNEPMGMWAIVSNKDPKLNSLVYFRRPVALVSVN